MPNGHTTPGWKPFDKRASMLAVQTSLRCLTSLYFFQHKVIFSVKVSLIWPSLIIQFSQKQMGQMLRPWKTIIELELDAPKAVFQQIADGIIEEIQKGRLLPGTPCRVAANWPPVLA
jgi:hypothetical protein